MDKKDRNNDSNGPGKQPNKEPEVSNKFLKVLLSPVTLVTLAFMQVVIAAIGLFAGGWNDKRTKFIQLVGKNKTEWT